MLNKPKELEEHDFEVPERLRETLAPSGALDAALALAHPPEEELVDSSDWETEFFSELEPEKIFSYPGNTPVHLLLERPEHHSLPLWKT